MDIRLFIQQAILSGIHLWSQNGRLRYSGPERRVTPQFLQLLRTHKEALLEQLLHTRPLPLSYGQQGLWAVHQLAPEASAYHVSLAYHLEGRLDLQLLQDVLQLLVDRHDALRTRFTLQDGYLQQQIDGSQTVAIELVDAVGWDEGQLQHQLAVQHARGFNLETGPLFRASIFRRGGEQHSLLITAHHIIVDAWSIYQLVDELFTLYRSMQRDQLADLPILQHTYGDYVAWQQQFLATHEERLWRYWAAQLEGELPLLQLHADRVRPPRQSLRGISYLFHVSPETTSRLRILARQQRSTLYTLLLAVYQLLLHRHTGQETIMVGLPMLGRSRPEFNEVVGYFVSPVVLQTTFAGVENFQSLLAQVRTRVLGALEHQEYPFALLVERLNPPRDLSRSPLYQSSFVLQRPHRAQALLQTDSVEVVSGLRASAIPFQLFAGQEDIGLELIETQRGLTGTLKGSADLFTLDTLERMAARLCRLLEALVQDGALQQPMTALPILPNVEHQQLLSRWQNPIPGYPHACLHQRFERQAAQTPSAVAVVFEDQQLTYAELNRRTNQLAHYLQALGVGPEMLVGLCVERSLEMVVGLLGILKAGGAYVPLDPSYPQERLAFMLEDAVVPILLTQAHLRATLPASNAHVIYLDDDWVSIAEQPTINPVSRVQPDNLAYVIYTSGSTGRPKGAMVTHQHVVRLFAATDAWFGFGSQDVWTLFHSIAFDFSVWELWGALLYGGRLVVVPYWISRSPTDFHALLQREQVTVLNQTPSAFRSLMAVLEMVAPAPLALRYVIFGGEALDIPSLRPWFEQHGETTPRLINMYGITETTVHVTYRPLTWADLESPASVIGGPIPDLGLVLLDQQGQLVPIGVPGELYVGGAGVCRGYLNRPELTAERFVANPFGPGRLYRTGDLARWLPDGNLEYLGRIDQQVKLRGFRIELGEIESVLSSHTAVQEVVVVAREDTSGETRLVAYVVGQGFRVQGVGSRGQEGVQGLGVRGQGTEDTRGLGPGFGGQETADGAQLVAELRSHLQSRLPDYMLPSAFVLLDALPLTPNGKLDRKALPAPAVTAMTEDDVPRTATEALLAAIWQQLLHLPQVGTQANFFTLGGHSLLATRIVSRIRQELAVDLPLRTLFEQPTIAGLAGAVDLLRQSQGPFQTVPIFLADRSQPLPLSYAQERLWFLDQLDADHTAYTIPGALRLRGALDVAALAQALQEVVHRHEVLRTTFVTRDGRPVQRVGPAAFPLPIVDLSGMEPTLRELEVRQHVQAEVMQPFDLAQGPLFRATLLCLEPGADYLLLLRMHHTVADAWSLDLLQRELTLLYAAFAHGRPSPLPELALQYVDVAAWQRQWLSGTILETQLAWWQRHLASAPELLTLPTDRPRPAVQSFRGASHAFTLPSELVQALRHLSRSQGTTLFMTLLAAFNVLLMRQSGQTDLVVGVPVAGRTRVEVEPLIGLFVNTLALRSHLTDADGTALSFNALLTQVRQTVLEAQHHQDVPFEQVVEALQPTRNLSHSPLFQVMFNLLQASETPLQLPGVAIELWEADYPVAKFDLTLSMVEERETTTATLEYHTDLFDTATIVRMAGHFQTLLAGIVADPAQSVVTLPMLTAAEREQLLVTWNDTAADYPQACIHERFEAQVVRTPDAVAVIFEAQQLSYAELNERANQVAHQLQLLGVGPEVLVGLCVERSLEMVVGLLGILKAGGAYVPLDPSYPQERLAFMLADAAVPVLLTQEQLRSTLPTTNARVICLDADWPTIAVQPTTNPVSAVRPDTLAYVIYTSGSTGRPKGALNHHAGLQNLLAALQAVHGLTTQDATLQTTTFSFDVATAELLWPLLHGARLILTRPHGQRDRDYLAAMLVQHQITTLHLVPTLLQLLVDVPAFMDCRSLRRVIAAGEALPLHLLQRMQAHPTAQLHNWYGPTETTIYVTAWAAQANGTSGIVPIGRPIANTQAYVLDAQLQPVPIGVAGELHIGGVQVGRGYLNRPELTDEKFIANPFGPGRLYKTGDLARWLSDGNLEYLGRIDQQVKLRGFRIELGEIESVLSSHGAVQEVAVVAREDVPGDTRLVAYVVERGFRVQGAGFGDEEQLVAELRSHLQIRLPDYMVPSAFVLLAALPLTPNGKLDRKALPIPTRDTTYRPLLRPRTRYEQQLTLIWTELLQIYPIGTTDTFFDLGGHSLLAIRLLAMINQRFNTALPLRTLFTHPTIATQAQLLTEATDRSAYSYTPLVTIQPLGRRPPLFCCPGAGGSVLYFHALASALGTDQPLYGLEPLGLDGRAHPHTSVEAAAVYQLQALRQQQPNGPYYLLGHSFGGLVAFEIAQQLYRSGEAIGVLIIIDTAAPGVEPELTDEVTMILRYERLYLEEFGATPSLTAAQLQPLTSNERLLALKQVLVTAGSLPPDTGVEQIRGIIAVAAANMATYYRPTDTHRLPIQLIMAADSAHEESQTYIEQWRSYGDVALHQSPGNHTSMIRAPHVQQLAQLIKKLL